MRDKDAAAKATRHAQIRSRAHTSIASVLRYFLVCDYLPDELRAASESFCDLAHDLAEKTSGPETTVALRKLLESKDAAVRARLHERIEP